VFAVIVSFYDQRSAAPLRRLIRSMSEFDAGLDHRLTFVVNRGSGRAHRLPPVAGALRVDRPNEGMNIGAWDAGWRANPDADGCLFLQDDCLVVRDGWLRAFVEAADRGVSLVGESFNENWDRPWNELRSTRGDVPLREHLLDGRPANRVDVYLDFMRRQSIEPGATGAHLRGLVWYLPKAALEALGGFPIGRNYGECIAAEIAVSRRIQQLGLQFAQVAPAPFTYVQHAGWDPQHPQQPITQSRHSDLFTRAARRLRP
jgi:hypothetical protein